MSDHLEGWARVKGAALADIPDKVVGYALVAVTKSGHLHWGAEYAEGGEKMLQGLNQIVQDIKHYEKQKKGGRKE